MGLVLTSTEKIEEAQSILDREIAEVRRLSLQIKAERDFLVRQLTDDADVDVVDGREQGNYAASLLARLEGFRDGWIK